MIVNSLSEPSALAPARQQIYKGLAEKIGNTPLVPYQGEVPNGNRIFVKLECENSYGNNHYDRVYLRLFYEKERLGLIHPGDNVFETSSGSAGISFAAIGRELGYVCHVAIPAGGEKAREQAAIEQGAQLYLTPQEEYVNGFKEFIKDFIKKHPGYVFMNHSMGDITGRGLDVNETAVSAMGDIADESLGQIREQGQQHCDFFLSAVGNGTNTLGIGRRLKEISSDTRLIGYETLASAVAFRMKNPGLYEDRFDEHGDGKVRPENFSRHSMPGTSFPGIDFPALRKSVEVLDEVVLVADEKMLEEFKQLAATDRNPDGVVQWDTEEIAKSVSDFGRSTRAGIAVALDIASRVQGKCLLVVAYDKANRYDR